MDPTIPNPYESPKALEESVPTEDGTPSGSIFSLRTLLIVTLSTPLALAALWWYPWMVAQTVATIGVGLVIYAATSFFIRLLQQHENEFAETDDELKY